MPARAVDRAVREPQRYVGCSQPMLETKHVRCSCEQEEWTSCMGKCSEAKHGSVSSFSFRLTLRCLRAIGNDRLTCMRRSGCAGPMAKAPEGSIAPGAFPVVLFVCFVELCILADPMAVDELYLHVFCSVSVGRFVRACYIATLVCGFACN